MKNLSFKRDILPHIVSVALFYLITIWFFSPLLKGKSLNQSDIQHSKNVTHQIIEYKKKNKEPAMWNPYTFSGMPAYIFGVKLPGQMIKNNIHLVFSAMIKGPANIVFITMLSMYILLLAYKTNNYVAALGAIAFAFGSFNIISIEAGHNSKINALSFMPLIFAGVQLLWRKKYILGSGVSLLGFTFVFYTGHYQIIYYIALLLTILFLVKGFFAIRDKNIKEFSKVAVIAVLISLGGLLSNIGNIWIVSDYQSESIRGNQVLHTKKNDESKSTSGLDRDYAFAWSQGIKESFTLLIHNAYGGGASEDYDATSLKSYNYLKRVGANNQQAANVAMRSMYWGDQPFTAGAIYAGATICFLFILGLTILPTKESVWIGVATLLFLMLSWGKNFETFNFFMFDYFPFYNKFRTVSMTLGIVNFTLVIGAALAVQKVFDNPKSPEILKKTQLTFGILGGLIALFWLSAGTFFSFSKEADELAQFTQMLQKEQIANEFYSIVISDRAALFSADALRSLIFISLCFVTILLYVKGVLNKTTVAIGLFLFVAIDVISIDKKYMAKEKFKRTTKTKKVRPSKSDKAILADNKDGKRVFVPGGGMNDSPTAYFHKSTGGYHPAKMRRYQDLADYHFGSSGQQPTMNVIRMLNVGYVKQGSENFVKIPNSLGHAWFVNKISLQMNADSVINKLYSIDPEVTALVNKKDFALSDTSFTLNENATISQTSFSPNKISYRSRNSNDGYAVFSEVYYNKGWEVTIDDKPVSYERVNYILRGLKIPAGDHKIDFEFKPTSYILGSKLNLAFTLATLLYSFGAIGFSFYRTQKD